MQSGEPEPFLVENHQSFESGTILDLACGDGRNGLFLAEVGFQVVGVDVSDVALKRFSDFTAARNLRVELLRLDLEEGLDPRCLPSFDHLLVSCYKPLLSLWEILITRLPIHGKIMVSTFNMKQHVNQGFPAKFCLSEKEYYQLHQNLEVEVHETREQDGKFTDCYILRKLLQP